jgi:hypothetical protein
MGCPPRTGGRRLPHRYVKTPLCITAKLIVEWQRWVKLGRAGDVRCTTALPPKADIHPRSCYVAFVPIPDSCSAANTGLCMTAKWNGPAVLLPCPKITLASAPKMKPS